MSKKRIKIVSISKICHKKFYKNLGRKYLGFSKSIKQPHIQKIKLHKNTKNKYLYVSIKHLSFERLYRSSVLPMVSLNLLKSGWEKTVFNLIS